MSPQPVRVAKRTETDLSSQAHKQVLDLLDVATRSKNPALRDAAIEMARASQSHQHKMDAKLSPNLAVSISLGILIGATIAVWWAIFHFSNGVSATLISVTVLLSIVMISLVALYAGFLSQLHFVSVIKMALSEAKRFKPTSWLRNGKLPSVTADDGSAEDK